ncbi:hydrogenase expression/formation protein HypE [Clostridium sp. YIM B02505]|uniref:Hydrogenase expression/formation protein HypE n=1 Tax=Clostridium yunnanense TaxID=2800325 RepID=A0ABS1EKI3_9CLOT|nr:hydrogenase expression/formation protein HypE [Clostridium yunnanense]
MDIITLDFGSGGTKTHELINNLFYKYFANDILDQQGDSSIINKLNGRIAITTDSYVVDPIFFPGGDIGKLSICGTINDLAVSGAIPLYITVGFIIEEGMSIKDLERIVISMAVYAKRCDVKIVAGDTKVVERGKGDRIYINTTGIGILEDSININSSRIQVGDKIIVSGTLGEHGLAILCQRQELSFKAKIKSDCNPLDKMIRAILNCSNNIKFIRDITRGGLSTILNEIEYGRGIGMVLYEKLLPIREEVSFICEVLGLDPLYIANEGKVVVIASNEDSDKILQCMRENEFGKDAQIIGEVVEDERERVILKTELGGTRLLTMTENDLIPRIC